MLMQGFENQDFSKLARSKLSKHTFLPATVLSKLHISTKKNQFCTSEWDLNVRLTFQSNQQNIVLE